MDFYSGLIYEAMGFPPDMFTVLFAIGRTPGWLAQWQEMLNDKEQKIAAAAPDLRGQRRARLRGDRLPLAAPATRAGARRPGPPSPQPGVAIVTVAVFGPILDCRARRR